MQEQYGIKNDILTVAYYMDKNNWEGASKTNFQRVLYFTAVLSSVFLKNYQWAYSFSNTMFGPMNTDISHELEELCIKGLLDLVDRKILTTRVEERYKISENGTYIVQNSFMKLESELPKILWIETIVKVLSIYGEKFLSKLIKEDPNISIMNSGNQNTKIPMGNTNDNLSKEVFEYLESNGKEKFELEDLNDEEYLIMFFDLLYRKYKGGN